MTASKNPHGVYEDREAVALVEGTSRIPLCEIRVAETSGGWRAVACFAFTTGNHWGHFGPITDYEPALPDRDLALSDAAVRLSERLSSGRGIEPAMQGQCAKIIAWLSALLKPEPMQLEMFA